MKHILLCVLANYFIILGRFLYISNDIHVCRKRFKQLIPFNNYVIEMNLSDCRDRAVLLCVVSVQSKCYDYVKLVIKKGHFMIISIHDIVHTYTCHVHI